MRRLNDGSEIADNAGSQAAMDKQSRPSVGDILESATAPKDDSVVAIAKQAVSGVASALFGKPNNPTGFNEWSDVLTAFAEKSHAKGGHEYEDGEPGRRTSEIWFQNATSDDIRKIAEEGWKSWQKGWSDSPRDAVQSAADAFHERGFEREQERLRDQRLDHDLGITDRQSELAALIEKTIPGLSFRQSAGGSWYANKRSKGDAPELKIRISDHHQVEGGGFNEGTGMRMGESDLGWIVDSPIAELPSPDEIWRTVLDRMHWLDNRPDASPKEIRVPERELHQLEVPLRMDKAEQERIAKANEFASAQEKRWAEQRKQSAFREKFASLLAVQGGKNRKTPEWSAFFKARTQASQSLDETGMSQAQSLLDAAMASTPGFARGGLVGDSAVKSNVAVEAAGVIGDAAKWLSSINSDAFKNWFGDWENEPEKSSKVVDESGKPRTVYHGTDREFDEFRNPYAGTGWEMFSESPEYADKFATGTGSQIKPVHLSIRNPLDLSHIPARRGDAREKLMETFHRHGMDIESLNQIVPFERDLFQLLNSGNRKPELVKHLTDHGFDGIKMPDAHGEMESTTWIAFQPTQIKSATGNRGSFDPNDPRIGFADGGNVSFSAATKPPAPSDIIPAMLSPGEVVLNKEQQERVGQQAGENPASVFAKAGVPGFASGGKVEDETTSQSPRIPPIPPRLKSLWSIMTGGRSSGQRSANIQAGIEADGGIMLADALPLVTDEHMKARAAALSEPSQQRLPSTPPPRGGLVDPAPGSLPLPAGFMQQVGGMSWGELPREVQALIARQQPELARQLQGGQAQERQAPSFAGRASKPTFDDADPLHAVLSARAQEPERERRQRDRELRRETVTVLAGEPRTSASTKPEDVSWDNGPTFRLEDAIKRRQREATYGFELPTLDLDESQPSPADGADRQQVSRGQSRSQPQLGMRDVSRVFASMVGGRAGQVIRAATGTGRGDSLVENLFQMFGVGGAGAGGGRGGRSFGGGNGGSGNNGGGGGGGSPPGGGPPIPPDDDSNNGNGGGYDSWGFRRKGNLARRFTSLRAGFRRLQRFRQGVGGAVGQFSGRMGLNAAFGGRTGGAFAGSMGARAAGGGLLSQFGGAIAGAGAGGGVAAVGAGLAGGAFATIALAALSAVKALSEWSKELNESNRALAKYNGTLSVAFAQLEMQRTIRNLQLASATGESGARLAGQINEMEAAQFPGRVAKSNLANEAGIVGANAGELLGRLEHIADQVGVFKAAETYLKGINAAIEVSNAILKQVEGGINWLTEWFGAEPHRKPEKGEDGIPAAVAFGSAISGTDPWKHPAAKGFKQQQNGQQFGGRNPVPPLN